MSFELRFWNSYLENVMVEGRYSHYFKTYEEAWRRANSLIEVAHSNGAIECTINNDCYPILNS